MRSDKLNVLIVGGSLGAQVLNEIVPQAMAMLPENVRPHITHQSGRNKLDALKTAYSQVGVQAQCIEFVDDMVSAYRDADVVICRAGALTIAELTAAGVGALLVPYPYAVDDHQTANAQFMVSAQAGLLLPQAQLSANQVAEILANLTREQCLQWAENARTLALPNSADDVAKIVIEIAK